MNFTGMLKDGTLKNKIVLITGGGTGLGKSMGKYFMELGAHLIITSRKQNILDNTAEEFEAYSGKIFPVSADVRDSKDVKRVIQASLEKFGKVDVVYSANTLSHIKNLNEVFNAINIILSEKGILILEDPSLIE